MILWEDEQRYVISTDELEEDEGRLNGTPLWRGNNDQFAGRHPLAIFLAEGLDAKRKRFLNLCNEEKRVVPPDKQNIIEKRIVHSALTFSDWQLGHMGCLPIPLNRSPQSLHR